jgi:hypothetical protein
MAAHPDRPTPPSLQPLLQVGRSGFFSGVRSVRAVGRKPTVAVSVELAC